MMSDEIKKKLHICVALLPKNERERGKGGRRRILSAN